MAARLSGSVVSLWYTHKISGTTLQTVELGKSKEFPVANGSHFSGALTILQVKNT